MWVSPFPKLGSWTAQKEKLNKLVMARLAMCLSCKHRKDICLFPGLVIEGHGGTNL